MFGGEYARGPEGSGRRGLIRLFVIFFAVAFCFSTGAKASAPEYAALVVDGHTGKTLHSRNADKRRFPASLTKMMTLYLVFEDIKAKRISLDTRLVVSKHAASRPPSKLGLKPGTTIRVRHAILALVTKSANDVATVVAENLAGSEKRFARRMTRTARNLGMSRTTFRNASGLPDKRQVTTARDMATLARALRSNFPKQFSYFKTRHFKYRGRIYRNHNRLLGKFAGTDGIKTGYTRASGFNLVSSVRRNGKYVVGVVIGERSGRKRNRKMVALLKRFIPRAVARKDLPRRRQIAAAKAPVAANAAAPRVLTNPVPLPKPASVSAPAMPLPRPVEPPRALAKTAQPPAAPAGKPTVIVSPASDLPGRKIGPVALRPSVEPRYEQDLRPLERPQIMASIAPQPLAAPEFDETEEVTAAVQAPFEKIRQDSWAIQIGAYSTQSAAEERLAEATATGVRAIKGKKAVAVQAEDTARPIYRARIAGFENRKLAHNACRALKRRAFRCYALAPN